MRSELPVKVTQVLRGLILLRGWPVWGGVEPRIGNESSYYCYSRGSSCATRYVLFAVFLWGIGRGSTSWKNISLYLADMIKTGCLTTDPQSINETKRLLPAGYWKGSALGIVLDMLVFLFFLMDLPLWRLRKIKRLKTAVSQLLIAFNTKKTISENIMQKKLRRMF